MDDENVTPQANIIGDGSMAGDDSVSQAVKAESGGSVRNVTQIAGGVHLRVSPHLSGKPFQAPPLPPHFVPRPDVSEALKARLLTEATIAPGVLVVSAIHGLGGVGKSTLVAALAYEADIQERFQDGILWATLGQKPDLLSILSGWIQALGDYDFRPSTVEVSALHLRTLLQDRAALIVIDDVWKPEHIIPFLVGGTCCQILITTRRADVADEVGAELYQLDVMTATQSLSLLSKRLGRSLHEHEQESALALAKTVGYLPLALELAAVRMARGTSWSDLHRALTAEIARLETLEDPHRRRGKGHLRLEASFYSSLDALKAEDEKAWQAFAWLGILPEDVTISAPMAATLWETDIQDAVGLLELLWNDALLLVGPPVRVEGWAWPGFRIHDLLHDIARRMLTTETPKGLGLTLPQAHAYLLKQYRKCTQGSLWHTLPDDGYIHLYLTRHMEQAGWKDELQNLLCEESAEGHNGWYQAKERLGQTAGYLEDVARVWQLAEAEGNIALQVRCALFQSSIAALSRNVSIEILVLSVQHNLLSPEQALSLILSKPEKQVRLEALVALVLHLPSRLRDQAFREALGLLQDAQFRDKWPTKTWAALIAHLPEELLREALTTARRIGDEGIRAQALTRLAQRLEKPIIYEALTAAREIEWDYYREYVLGGLASRLAELSCPEEALAVVKQEIKRESIKAEVLKRLALHLSEPSLQEALAAAREIRDPSKRGCALAGLAPYLPELLLHEVVTATYQIEESSQTRVLAELAPYLPESLLRQILLQISEFRDKGERARALLAILPSLPRSLRHDALTMAQEIPQDEGRTLVLAEMASYLQEALLRQTLSATQRIECGPLRVRALEKLTPYLPKTLLREILVAIENTQDERCRVAALVSVAPHLPQVLLTEAVEIARRTHDGDLRSWAVAGLAPRLPGPLLEETLAAIEEIESEWKRVRALVRLAPFLTKPILQKALRVVQETEDTSSRAYALAGLAPYLAESLLQEALAVAQEIQHRKWRARALGGLAPYLVDSLKEEALSEALTAAQQIGDENERMTVLSELAIHLPKSLLQRALAITQEIRDEVEQVRVLSSLVPHLPDSLREEALGEAVAAARKVRDERHLRQALLRLAPHLPKTLLWEALVTVLELQDQNQQAIGMAGLMLHVSKALFSDALAGMEKMSTDVREYALAEMVYHLPKAQLVKFLAAVREIRDVKHRALVSAEVVRYLPESLRKNLIGETLEAAYEMQDENDRVPVLETLASLLLDRPPDQRLGEAFGMAQQIRDKRKRALFLLELAPYSLREKLVNMALDTAWTIQDEDERRQILTRIASAMSDDLSNQALKETVEAMQKVSDIEHPELRYQFKYLSGVETMLGAGNVLYRSIIREDWNQDRLGVTSALNRPFAEKTAWRSFFKGLVTVPPVPLLRDALERALSLRDRDDGLEALRQLAPFLPKTLLWRTLEMVSCLHSRDARACALAELAPYLSEESLLDTLRLLRDVQNEEDQARAFNMLASYLTKPLSLEVVTMTQEIDSDRDQIVALTGPDADSPVHSTTISDPHLCETLHTLGHYPRPHLFSNLGALFPAIARLGGDEAATDTFRAIQDVCRWWP